MKRIAIFFDGTSNRSDAEYQTNVVLLSRCVALRGYGDTTQVVQYYQGVGTGRGTNAISKMVDRALGGALAYGLMDIVQDAYRALVYVYEPGDEIYIFGFSRGAFTARVFAGLLRSCGIPPRSHLRDVPDAIERHLSNDPTTEPDTQESIAFRGRFAPGTATSVTDFAARKDSGALLLTISYLGLWDTVKSFAVAQNRAGGQVPVPKLFHDLELSRMVESARHAMALDERRKLYPVVPFTNFGKLNGSPVDGKPPRYLQEWFPGDHGSVGGGGNRIHLSSIALRWVATGAVKAGLRLVPSDLDLLAWHMNACGPLSNKLEQLSLAESLLALFKADRIGPETADELSVAALDRSAVDEPWRGSRLATIKQSLALSAEDLATLRQAFVARDGGPTHWPADPPGAVYWPLPGEDD